MDSQKKWGHPNVEQKTDLATGAKLQIPTRHAPLLQTNAGIPGHLRYERYPCACPVLGEEDADPRSREMTPGDENDILHAVDPQAEIVGDLHAVVDVLDQPFTEIAPGDCVLAFCRERKG